MTIQVFGADATVSYLNRAFTDTSPANAIYVNQVANAKSMGDAAFANAFAASWAGTSNAALSKQVLTNMGILPTTDTSVAALEQALTDYFAAFGVKTTGSNGQVTADTRGLIVLQLSTIVSGLETNTGALAVYNAAAVAWNNEVAGSYTYSVNTANTTPSVAGAPTVGNTYTLTTASDSFTGTAGNDIFNGNTSSSGDTFTAFDSIDGGAGTDTLNAAVSGTTAAAAALPGGISVKNVENININATNVNAGTFVVDASAFSGLTNLSVTNTKGAVTINNAGTVAVTASSADNVVTVNGGTVVNATPTVGAPATITGSALTTVSVKNGQAVVENAATAGATAASTLTAVTLNNVATGNTIKGSAVANLTWQNQTAGATAVITNATSTALTLNVDGVGYTSAGAIVTDSVTVGAAATSVTINATGAKSDVVVLAPGALVKTVNVTGSAALTLGDTTNTTAFPTSVTKVDASAATGAITLNSSLGTTSALTINTGSGADTVTLKDALAAGTAISLGAGNDKLLINGGSLVATPGTIDGGAGTDSVSIALLNGASAAVLAKFVNFEQIDISGTGTVDASAIAGITGLTLSSTLANAVVTNLPAAAGLTVTNQSATTILAGTGSITLASISGGSDSFTLTFAGTGSDSTLPVGNAGTLTIPGIENLNIVSGGTGATTGNAVSIADSTLQTLTITGGKNLALTLAAANGQAPSTSSDAVNGLKLIDGSAATGKLTIDASTVTVGNIANAGLTIKGGTGADTITGTSKADTIIGGGGADVITGGDGADKITLSGNTSTVAIATASNTGPNNATATQTALLTAALDIVTGATAGTKFTIADATVANIAQAFTTSATLATNLQGANDSVVFARGTYDAANGIFSYGAAGPDTAMTYDAVNVSPAGAGTDFHTVILVGFVPSTTTAATSAYSTGVATITLA